MLHTRSPVARCTMLPARILGSKYWAFAQKNDFVLLNESVDSKVVKYDRRTNWSILCKLLHNIFGHVFKNSVLFLHGMTEIKTKQYRTFWSRFSWTIGINLFQWFLVLSVLQFADQFIFLWWCTAKYAKLETDFWTSVSWVSLYLIHLFFRSITEYVYLG